MIDQLGDIEKNVFDNEILFKHCLFYLTLFEYRGITENELEDILSIDDEVLDTIFVHNHPPLRRFQIGLFSRLKYELKKYITDKTTDDQYVIAWRVCKNYKIIISTGVQCMILCLIKINIPIDIISNLTDI